MMIIPTRRYSIGSVTHVICHAAFSICMFFICIMCIDFERGLISVDHLLAYETVWAQRAFCGAGATSILESVLNRLVG